MLRKQALLARELAAVGCGVAARFDAVRIAATRSEPAEVKSGCRFDRRTRRTVYGFVGRRKLERHAGAVRFPAANEYGRAAHVTNVPLQRLFLMNSTFVEDQAKALAKRLPGNRRRKDSAGVSDSVSAG